jgi:hypothetical protein
MASTSVSNDHSRPDQGMIVLKQMLQKKTSTDVLNVSQYLLLDSGLVMYASRFGPQIASGFRGSNCGALTAPQ